MFGYKSADELTAKWLRNLDELIQESQKEIFNLCSTGRCASF